jgi:hypothetical protein
MPGLSPSHDLGPRFQGRPAGFKGFGEDFSHSAFEALSKGYYYTLLKRLSGELCCKLPPGSHLSKGYIPVTHTTKRITLVSG